MDSEDLGTPAESDNQQPPSECKDAENAAPEIKRSTKRDDAAGEWFEDAESDADWVEGLSLAGTDSFLDNASAMVSCNPGLEEVLDKNALLEEKLKDTEKQLQQVQAENEKLTAQLTLERRRSLKFQKKLKYIEDNHEIFNRLKEAYLNMKYNESTGRGLTQIKESSSQTWDGIMCETCIKTAEYKAQRDLENLCEFTGNSCRTLSIKQTAIDEISDTVEQIKALVDKREKTYAQNEQREQKQIEIIKSLEKQNKILQDLVKSRQLIMHPLDAVPEKLPNNHDSAFMKKIIFKQEKRLREMLKYNRYRKYTISPLNDNEKEFVELIVSQYLRRTGKKSSTNIRCRSCDRDPRPESAMVMWAGRGDDAAEKLRTYQNQVKRGSAEIDLIDFSETATTDTL